MWRNTDVTDGRHSVPQLPQQLHRRLELCLRHHCARQLPRHTDLHLIRSGRCHKLYIWLCGGIGLFGGVLALLFQLLVQLIFFLLLALVVAMVEVWWLWCEHHAICSMIRFVKCIVKWLCNTNGSAYVVQIVEKQSFECFYVITKNQSLPCLRALSGCCTFFLFFPPCCCRVCLVRLPFRGWFIYWLCVYSVVVVCLFLSLLFDCFHCCCCFW